MSIVLTEEEFDRLPEQSQKGYRWCVKCETYFKHIECPYCKAEHFMSECEQGKDMRNC